MLGFSKESLEVFDGRLIVRSMDSHELAEYHLQRGLVVGNRRAHCEESENQFVMTKPFIRLFHGHRLQKGRGVRNSVEHCIEAAPQGCVPYLLLRQRLPTRV